MTDAAKPGVKGADDRWRGFDWVSHQATEDDLVNWHAMGAGIGVKAGAYPDGTWLLFIDADVLNEAHAKQIEDEIYRRFGSFQPGSDSHRRRCISSE